MTATHATYKGRTYLLRWSGTTKYGQKAKLAFLDGSKEFWVDLSTITVGAAASAKRVSSSHRSGHTYECEECGEYVVPGTRCWETGMMH